MMKGITFQVLAASFLFAFISCKSQHDFAEASAATETHIDTIVVIMEKEPATQDSLLIAFEKTPCFGRCPVYKIKVYGSGFATYEGLNFAERMGLYSTRFGEEEIRNIFNLAEAADYRGFQNEYDDRRVTDLPSTISVLVFQGERHRVKSRLGAPEHVKMFHENLAELLTGKDWEPYDER